MGDAQQLAQRLLRAIQTALNDDVTEIGTEARLRHLDRLDAMSDAAEFLRLLAEARGYAGR